MGSLSRRPVWLFPLTLAGSLAGIYFSTLAPGLSWANNGADGGDLISAAATGGVPHPTGYPTYILLARLFQFLPFGSLAFRTNLLSAVLAILAALLLYFLVISLPYRWAQGNPWAGWLAAFAYGISPLVWSQAVITEVYSLNAFFIAALLLLLLPDERTLLFKPAVLNCLRGVLFGLAMGNHITILAFLPVMVLLGVFRKADGSLENDAAPRRRAWFHQWKFDWQALATQSACFLLGLSVYIVLPLRALTNPPINWGNPITLKNFFWLVSGHLYGERVFTISQGTLLARLGTWARFLSDQYGIPGLAVALAGLFFCRPLPRRMYLVSGWIVAVFFAFSLGYDSYDSIVLLIPVSLVLALWIGLGSSFVIKALSSRHAWMGLGGGILLLMYLAARIPSAWSQVDASRDRKAETFGEQVMATVPADALIFTSGDKDTFAIWYYHFALRQRPDISVLVSGLLPFDWYRETLRSVYPSLAVPERANKGWNSAIVEANPTRPVCYTNSLGEAAIHCR